MASKEKVSTKEGLGVTNCPDPECQSTLHKIEEALYGKDGTGGLVRCVANKVPKKWLYAILGAIAIPVISIGAKIWSDNQSAIMRFADKQAIAAQNERIVKLESSYAMLYDAIKELKDNQYEMRRDIKNILKELRFGRNTDPTQPDRK